MFNVFYVFFLKMKFCLGFTEIKRLYMGNGCSSVVSRACVCVRMRLINRNVVDRSDRSIKLRLFIEFRTNKTNENWTEKKWKRKVFFVVFFILFLMNVRSQSRSRNTLDFDHFVSSQESIYISTAHFSPFLVSKFNYELHNKSEIDLEKINKNSHWNLDQDEYEALLKL